MTQVPDPADKSLDAQADGAFGGRKQTVGTDCNPNRRAGYTKPLERALRMARIGGTLAAGEGALIVAHFEERLAATEPIADAARAYVASLDTTIDPWGHGVDDAHDALLRAVREADA